jgi:methyl-accepting chemotaxis protein
MKLLNKLTVKARLYGTLGLVLSLMMAVIALAVWNSRQTAQEVDGLLQSEFRKYELVTEIDSAIRSNAKYTMQLFIVDESKRGHIRERMNERREEINGLLKVLEPMLYKPEGRALFQELVKERTAYVAAFTEASKLLGEGKEAQAHDVAENKVTPQIPKLDAVVGKLKKLQMKLAHDRGDAILKNLAFQVNLSLVFGALALFIGISSAYLLIRSITKPLAVAHSVTQAIGKGNLAVRFDIEGEDELAQMLISLHHMQEHLAHVMMRIQESSIAVASASSEIAAANIDLSARTESQASALEETASTMEEMTSTVQNNATTTRRATQIASEASHIAQEVGELVGRLVSTMSAIHESSGRIRDIVGVIDAIAFQTNILALNAAVEAARAGEQGRGFAVVAAEVRALAQRSAKSAQEIKSIIEDNVSKMDAGNEVASRAGSSVEQVVSAIEKVSTTVAEVDVATREQSQGIAQVGQAVNMIDQTTQQNAALVEETSAATQNLDAQVQALKKQISRFELGSVAVAEFARGGAAKAPALPAATTF